jgi:hypothetical protein
MTPLTHLTDMTNMTALTPDSRLPTPDSFNNPYICASTIVYGKTS